MLVQHLDWFEFDNQYLWHNCLFTLIHDFKIEIDLKIKQLEILTANCYYYKHLCFNAVWNMFTQLLQFLFGYQLVIILSSVGIILLFFQRRIGQMMMKMSYQSMLLPELSPNVSTFCILYVYMLCLFYLDLYSLQNYISLKGFIWLINWLFTIKMFCPVSTNEADWPAVPFA